MNRKQRKEAVDNSPLTFKDNLEEDMIAKLQQAKNELKVIEQAREKEEQERKRKERQKREKNKSFEELLEQYGDIGSKYK